MAAKSSKAKKSTQRKLTAILSADVVGYSRLMGDDEEATVATLGAYRKVFNSKIKNHRGRVVDAKGDAIWEMSVRRQRCAQDQIPLC